MRIGLYGGSFDPVHHGHLLLAREALERLALDEVRFLPAAQSPFKPDQQLTPAPLRVAMLKAATEKEPGFVVDERELFRPPPSYTIDTVEAISRENPGAELILFVGADHAQTMAQWHRAADLMQAVKLVMFTRPGFNPDTSDIPVIEKHFDISASEIRQRVAAGKSIRFLVPESVEELIQTHRLYQTPA